MKLYNIDGELIFKYNTRSFKKLIKIAIENEISLIRANMYNTYLAGVVLKDINLTEANLKGAILRGADLSEASLEKAILIDTDLRGANLYNANLNGAIFHNTKGIRIFTAGDKNRLCFTYRYNGEQRFQLGCFNGNFDETIENIIKKYGNSSIYEKIITVYKYTV